MPFVLFVVFEPQKTQKNAKIIYDSCCYNLLFLRILRILWFFYQRIFRFRFRYRFRFRF